MHCTARSSHDLSTAHTRCTCTCTCDMRCVCRVCTYAVYVRMQGYVLLRPGQLQGLHQGLAAANAAAPSLAAGLVSAEA